MNITHILVPRLYLNQHRVLEKIYDVPNAQEFPDISELSKSLQLDEKEVMQAAYLLKGRGFAFVQRDKQPFVVGCTPEGAQALLQQSLLEEGKEKMNANLLRGAQIFGIVIASVISIATFIMNSLITVKNSNRIEALKVEVNSLKENRK
ncbi:MAG: hypothetical protein EOO61_20920 [Hymenobacter sp.]|nr:MAG: hypothetical protein EOO61_20920 [Hymenobacter sp.]